MLDDTLTFKLPRGAKLFIPYIGFIWDSTGNYEAEYDIERFITLVKNRIKSLNEVDLSSECIGLFRDYLIETSANNLSKLKETFFSLPEDRRVLFEIADYKDPLLAFMKTGKEFTREQREYMLNDYFDGEWIELK